MQTSKSAKVINKSVQYVGKAINRSAVNKDSIEAMTPETDTMVRGIFKNLECPGQSAKLCFRLYKGMQPFNQVMDDGETYTIPLSVARAINRDCCYSIHGHILDEKGQQIKGTGRIVHRYEFISTDFR